jgi:tetratricopeptide (TPR) repeat protein
MNDSRSSSWLLPVAALLLLWGVVFSMATQLTLSPLNLFSGNTSVAERWLGASRVALGNSFFEEADNYFHKGVGHVQQKAFSNDLFQMLKAEIEPSVHVHPEGVEVSEIMPWLRFTTEMDPNNVDAYLTTAYWLEGSIRRPDLAEAVLREAQMNNPKDYRVINERAKMLFGTGNDGKAATLLDAAIKLWPGGQDPEDQQTRIDLAQMLSYRAFLFELNGHCGQALDLFKKAYARMPNNNALEQRVHALERGEDFSQKDRHVWESVFARRHVCAREGADHEDEDEQDRGMNE